jgi:hypothetical protein
MGSSNTHDLVLGVQPITSQKPNERLVLGGYFFPLSLHPQQPPVIEDVDRFTSRLLEFLQQTHEPDVRALSNVITFDDRD